MRENTTRKTPNTHTFYAVLYICGGPGYSSKIIMPKFWNSLYSEAVAQRCYVKKMFWKYAVNLQENTHAEIWF